MLEMLLSSGAKKAATFWPDSGPGTKMLQYGDQTAGYFGEVSQAELYDSLGVVSLSGIVNGTIYPGDLTWLKFFIDSKVVYYAKQQVMVNLTWEQVYSAGCALGVRGIGPYPVGAGVDQFRVGYVKEGNRNWALLLRLPKTGQSDPALVDATNVLTSEWNRTLMMVLNGAGWGTYAVADLARSSADATSMCAETWTNSTTYVYIRGAVSNLAARANIPKTQLSYWRPVLELLDASKVALEPQYFEYGTDGLIAPALVEQPPPLETILKNIVDLYWTNPLQSAPSITEASFLQVAVQPAEVVYGIPVLKDFGIVIEDVNTIVRQQLIWSIGPLNEFGFTAETI